jgi:hypothetical protein
VTTVDAELLKNCITSLGAPRNMSEVLLINEMRRELDMVRFHTNPLNADTSIAMQCAAHSEANVESLLYAIRVLRGVA